MAYGVLGIGVAGWPNNAFQKKAADSHIVLSADWEIYSLYVQLNTSAVVGNRISQVKVVDPDLNIVRAITWPGTTPASAIKTLNTVEGAAGATVTLGGGRSDVTTVMAPFLVPTGYRLVYNDDAAIDPASDMISFAAIYRVWGPM